MVTEFDEEDGDDGMEVKQNHVEIFGKHQGTVLQKTGSNWVQ